MNKVFMIGRLTADPELRTTATDKTVATFKIAVDRRFKKDGDSVADFFPVVAWGKVAELCGKYLSKGKKIALVGELQTRSYEAKDGTKRYITEIIADEVEFLSPRDNKEGIPEGFVEIEDNDLPF